MARSPLTVRLSDAGFEWIDGIAAKFRRKIDSNVPRADVIRAVMQVAARHENEVLIQMQQNREQP